MLDLSHVSGLEQITGYGPPIIMVNSLEGEEGVDEVLEAIERTHYFYANQVRFILAGGSV